MFASDIVIFILLLVGISTLLLSIIAVSNEPSVTKYLRNEKWSDLANKTRQFVNEHVFHPLEDFHPASPYNNETASHVKSDSAMTCQKSFEPKCEMYPYVRFWNKRFFPEDCYMSPLRHPLKDRAPIEEQKFLVFEPDRGGWNNIRMAAETAIVLAHVTGRTLVLPPIAKWYLLDKNTKVDKNKSTFDTFFELRKIKESVNIITMEEFLSKVAMVPGMLNVTYVPKGPEISVEGDLSLWKYLESACYVRQWEPGKFFIGVNLSYPSAENGNQIFGSFQMNLKENYRYRTMVAHGRKLLPYDADFHSHRAIFFPGDYRNTHRILTHFYTYIYFAQHHVEQIYKRIVRDRLHYHDDIFCAAGKVVKLLHEDAARLSGKAVQSMAEADAKTLGGNTNTGATYFAYHVRRGEFQYHETRLSAEQIWGNTVHLLNRSASNVIYIATDERDREFFKPFIESSGMHIRFIGDYLERAGLTSINQNFIGMIEQVVCANAHTFIGTPRSSFTGYITRMRGYYRDGRYSRTYYTMSELTYQLQKQRELIGPFWAREFEVAHKDIDDYYQTH